METRKKRTEPATRPMTVALVSGEVIVEGSISEELAVELGGLELPLA